jgi:hypothetical protein
VDLEELIRGSGGVDLGDLESGSGMEWIGGRWVMNESRMVDGSGGVDSECVVVLLLHLAEYPSV